MHNDRIEGDIMLTDYEDIRKRIKEEPKWFDTHGIPRYDKFHPSMLSPYGKIAVLYLIECQSCNNGIIVADSYTDMDLFRAKITKKNKKFNKWLREIIELINYGDPPRHNDVQDKYCHAGCAMSSNALKIIELWYRKWEWRRVNKFKGISLK